MHTLLLLALSLSSVLAAPPFAKRAPIQCPIVFDGRVPTTWASNPSLFDSYATNTIFNPDYVKGNNLTWSSILLFPNVSKSRFDAADHTPVEVTLSDNSIFQQQTGFRRAGLQFLNDARDGPGQTGVKTLHWSVKQDAGRPLNLTHEYLNVWHEKADYSANQIQFQAGQLIGQPPDSPPKNTFKVLDGEGALLYSTPIDASQWQNFALTLDYVNNQVTIYYSAGTAALTLVAGPAAASLAGGGQFQLGILKKPTGTGDVVHGGYQESGLNEGQIYEGVFLEDGAGGCVSL